MGIQLKSIEYLYNLHNEVVLEVNSTKYKVKRLKDTINLKEELLQLIKN